jgi:abortive infection bacteriophage resistance protein
VFLIYGIYARIILEFGTANLVVSQKLHGKILTTGHLFQILFLSQQKTSKSQFLNPQRRLYFQLIVIQALIKKILPINNWANNLIHLLERNHHVSKLHMGFPNDWESQKFWVSPNVYQSL